jgi:enterochelin esterase family protein
VPAPVVGAETIKFRHRCPDRGLLALGLDCDPAVPGGRLFDRQGDTWALDLPRPAPSTLHRIEYRLRHQGVAEDLLLLDEANPSRVRTVFGERSVLELPGYRSPAWLGATAHPGHLTPLVLPSETPDPVPVTMWEPHGFGPGDPLPLLLAHDGPEYDRLAALTHYSGALIAGGVLPPHRVLLAHPVLRDAWYSGSPQYLRTISGAGLARIRQLYAVRSPIVVMGASLGGLTALLVGLVGDPAIGGVFAQSGSFFQVRTDPMEVGFRYFPRIVDRVRAILHARHTDHPLRVGLTCGVLEENAPNNAAMATALERAGHRVSHSEVPDLHNYTAWRDALDPHLTHVLLDTW